MSLRSKLRLFQLKVLNDVQVASPCSADWNAMEGDDKVRFCGECRLHVFNLSAMDPEEAAAKVTEHTDRLCVRFFRRHDGSILTQDCPVGVERKARSRRVVLRVSAVAAGTVLAGMGFSQAVAIKPKQSARGVGDAPNPPSPEPPVMMGALAAPEPREVMGERVTPPREEFMGKLARP